jgi:hypothetical protein
MSTIKVSTCVAAALLGSCNPKGDREEKCHGVVEHMRKVSMMPMRDGDVMMLMGSCRMWSEPLFGCYMATKNDDDIKKCRDMEK